MLTELHREFEYRFLAEMFHGSHLLTPHVLQLNLYSFDREKESEQTVVFFNSIGAEY